MLEGQEIEYYTVIPIGLASATTVFRFYLESVRLPERFTKSNGWVEDRDLMLMKMKGEIAAVDRISEAEASEIIARLSGE